MKFYNVSPSLFLRLPMFSTEHSQSLTQSARCFPQLRWKRWLRKTQQDKGFSQPWGVSAGRDSEFPFPLQVATARTDIFVFILGAAVVFLSLRGHRRRLAYISGCHNLSHRKADSSKSVTSLTNRKAGSPQLVSFFPSNLFHLTPSGRLG